MKKLQLNFDSIKKTLNKDQMRQIVGGYGSGAPDGPTDSGGGGTGSGYKCCWKSDPTNCSACNPNATSNWTCVTNAVLTKC